MYRMKWLSAATAAALLAAFACPRAREVGAADPPRAWGEGECPAAWDATRPLPAGSLCDCAGKADCRCGANCVCPQCFGPQARPTRLEVRCPPGAVVCFDGVPTSQTGAVRRFETTTAGGTYVVTCCDGAACTVRRVRVEPGKDCVIDFGGTAHAGYYAPPPPLLMPPPVPAFGGFGGGFSGGGGC